MYTDWGVLQRMASKSSQIPELRFTSSRERSYTPHAEGMALKGAPCGLCSSRLRVLVDRLAAELVKIKRAECLLTPLGEAIKWWQGRCRGY
jgi:hypothetical protein